MKLVYFLASFFLILLAFFSSSTMAVEVGRCLEYTTGTQFRIYDNFTALSSNSRPGTIISLGRDPTGQTLVYLPSTYAGDRLFITWDKREVRINQWGISQIGDCNIDDNWIRHQQVQIFGLPTQYRSVTTEVQEIDGTLVDNSPETSEVPTQLVDRDIDIVNPGVATLTIANECASTQGNRKQFFECVTPKMLGKKEAAYYQCMKNNTTKEGTALCALGESMGQNERQAMTVAQVCYAKYGSDYSKYPLCAAANGYPFTQDTSRAIQCMQKGGFNSGKVNYLSVGVCFAGDRFTQGMNQESRIAMECAVSSGGEPSVFASCTTSRLTFNELNKCLTNGIGGSGGCFGPNNTIVKALAEAQDIVDNAIGENNEVAKAFKSLTTVPGHNHVAVRTVNQAIKAGGSVGKEISRAAKRVGIRIKW